MNRDQLAKLEADDARLREELREQWEINHHEHCGDEWPHPEGHFCHWPVPEVLAAPSVLPELLRRLDLAEQALAPLVMRMQSPRNWCAECGYRPGHNADCRVAAAGRVLAELRAPLDQPEETT